MRKIVVAIGVLVALATIAYAAPITGNTFKMIGGGTDAVAHCQVIDYDIAASDTISIVNANVECDITDSYTVSATVTSGASNTSGQTATSLTANTPLVVAVTISPSVTLGSQTYDVDVRVN